MDDQERRARNIAAVRGAFAGVSAADADAQLTYYADDAVIEMPFTTPPSRHEGKDTLRAVLSAAFDTFKMQLTIDDLIECADPDQLVVEYHSDGMVTTTGKPYRNRYIARFRFRDGRIVFQREYFDSTAAGEALTPD